MNWIGKHSIHSGYIQLSLFVKSDDAPAFNFVYRSIAPVVYITLVSAILYTFKQDWIIKNIYMVAIYHSLFRLIFNLVFGRYLLLNLKTQVAYILVSVSLSYYVYENIILNKEFFFPSSERLGNALWLGVIGFLYHTFNSINFDSKNSIKRKEKYLESVFDIYYKKYNKVISNLTQNKEIECLIFSVLIYENFNRPKLIRAIENQFFKFGKAKTLGIMQVTTDKFIDDNESVRLGSLRIINEYELHRNEWDKNHHILKAYNPDINYIHEVKMIYNELLEKYYKELIEVENIDY
ncbi:hypothetical protein [Flammeovirga sp. OC4]|uniref:hypothetical protein n=1 Tax=Flammeovirga sp. OC4 TaxID=1382345 RepID=UPI001C1262FA|nr:hypothetical protein [Flammeovirga sp. OC4]